MTLSSLFITASRHPLRHLLPLALLSALAIAPPAWAEKRTYEIDPEHFSIGFSIPHVGYADVIGLFTQGSGEFVYDEATQTLHEGRVEIAADSVFTAHEERDEHVRDEDFLNTDDNSEIVFVARKLTTDSPTTGTLEGDLTLRGETHPVTLDVTLNKAARYSFGHKEYVLGVSASTVIERSRWGMDYAVDNGLVGDEVALRLEFEAIRQ